MMITLSEYYALRGIIMQETKIRNDHFSMHDCLIIFTIAVSYFFAHQISFLYPDSAKVLMAIWPAAGIGLASLLLTPRYLWPAIIAALFVAGNTANLLDGRPLLNSVGFMTANVFESWLSAWMITEWCGKNITFTRVKEIISLVYAAVFVNALTASIGAGTAALTHIDTFWNFWKTWWVADGLGILLVTPFVVTAIQFPSVRHHVNWKKTGEILAFYGVWIFTALESFHFTGAIHMYYAKPYIFFVLILWGALRFGQLWASLAICILSVLVISGEAVFTLDVVDPQKALMVSQVYLACVCVTGFLLAAFTAEQKTMVTAIRNSEIFLDTIIMENPFAIWISDKNGLLIRINKTCCKIMEIAEKDVIGKYNIFEDQILKDQGLTEKIRKVFDSGEVVNFEVQYDSSRLKNVLIDKFVNKTLAVTISPIFSSDGKLTNAVIQYMDVTAQKTAEYEHQKLENQIQQNQKLESLGVLAGGIAHDFNNLMGGIFGYIDMANEESHEPGVTKYLSKALSTIDRARALTQQLLTFSKGGAPIRKTNSLSPFIEETAQFALSGSSIFVSFDISRDLWHCDFDKNQIAQVIDNIVINAKEAMSGGGTLIVTARNISLSGKEYQTLPGGDYVEVSFHDSGIGIPKEVVSRIFDPFYTTKTTGHGLGLATCHSIISKHGGHIEVESESGKGTVFHIFLPAVRDAKISETVESYALHEGQGTFLVMDDEEVMRDTIGNMLESFGYTVTLTKNGTEAIDIFKQETPTGRKISGMIFDLTIPGGMGGKETVLEIRKNDSLVPVFVASGYAKDPVVANPAEYGFTASICKPFTKHDLSELLNAYLKPR